MQRIFGILIIVLYENDLDFPRRLSIVELRYCVVVSSNRFDCVADGFVDLQSVWHRIWPCNKTLLDVDHEECLTFERGVRMCHCRISATKVGETCTMVSEKYCVVPAG